LVYQTESWFCGFDNDFAICRAHEIYIEK
jgi:hypothetical protein